MTLAHPKKLASLNTTQTLRTMRPERIQNTRHPNLRQHAILRSKNRTNHLLPNPDISLARDRIGIKPPPSRPAVHRRRDALA
jgi:hypothetical protein